MPASGNMFCPECGRPSTNPAAVLCSQCKVPFVERDSGESTAGGAKVYSWTAETAAPKGGGATPPAPLWMLFITGLVLVCLVSYAYVNHLEKKIQAKSEESIREIQARNSNQLSRAVSSISNQIIAQLSQPAFQSTVEQAARDQVNRIVASRISPALKEFQGTLAGASAELSDATNALEELRSAILSAQSKLARIPTNLPAGVNPDPGNNNLLGKIPSSGTAPAQSTTTSNQVHLNMVTSGITQSGTNYILTLVFQSGAIGGTVDMMVATYKQTARIINFSAINAASQDNPSINDTADVAELRYVVAPNVVNSLVLVVSAPTIVRFGGDSLDVPLTLPIAAEKMNLAGAAR